MAKGTILEVTKFPSKINPTISTNGTRVEAPPQIDAPELTPARNMAVPGSRNFASCYMDLCKQQRLRPLPIICVTLPHSLDFTTDRVKMDDWGPILNSLSLDRTLRSISVRSRYQCRKPLEEVNSEDKARAMGKAPVVLTRYLLEWLSHSVGQCIRNSPSLSTLELEGIPFPPDCLAVLCVGLSSTQTLHHLSLQRCYIGDSGCELICRTIADVQSIRSLNLSYCDLTVKCGTALAAALSRQKLSLYHDTWKQSLRYQEPNFNAMPGLRRLTLNDNPHLGDTAVIELIEAIRDSLWLKALDIQRCGLSDRIGKDLLELLDYNSTLIVLDVRQNANLNEDIVKEIIQRLCENSTEGKSEYKWFNPPQKDQRTASADSRKRNENEESTKPKYRPRSATTAEAKRPYQALPPRGPSVAPTKAKRTKVRPHVPLSQERSSQRRDQNQDNPQDVRSKSKVSLHLDLRSRIQPLVGDAAANSMDKRSQEDDIRQREDDASGKSAGSIKIDVATEMAENLEGASTGHLQNLLKQLAEAQAEHDRLLEEAGRSDVLLAEERGRREAAEAKLRAMKKNLAELENALKEKESETRGFLLLSQQSLDEICSSFDRLLEMLESVTRNPASNRKESTEAAIVRADIRRRVTSVIRKTKSENLRRGYVVDVDEIESPRYIDVVKKFAKSESDVRTTLPPISTMHLERNIGDSPDIVSPTLEGRSVRRQEVDKTPMSPGERARAIFARIINGDTVLDFCSHVD